VQLIPIPFPGKGNREVAFLDRKGLCDHMKLLFRGVC
jgi:hypothetical protein